jgi:primosomal protein N''
MPAAACTLVHCLPQASWSERERALVAQVEALRRDRAEAAARAAAAAEGHDMAQWQVRGDQHTGAGSFGLLRAW